MDRKKPKVVRHILHLSIPADLKASLVQLAVAKRRKISAEAIIALEKHLGEQGYWPPPSKIMERM